MKELIKRIAKAIKESPDYEESQHDDEILIIGVELDMDLVDDIFEAQEE